MADVTLLQFRYSPYNEKVRWVLDLKRVPHVRRSLLPGPHAPVVFTRTRQTATPILELDGRWIAGSAAIVAALDDRFPAPPLRPDTPAARDEAGAIEARFDDGFVPRMRRAALAALMTDPDRTCRLFGEGAGPLAAWMFRALFPVTRILIAKGNGIDGPAAIEDGKRACAEALDFVAQASAQTGHLVGDRFTHADLAAAAGLAMVFPPAGSPMDAPGPRPAASQALVDAHAGHPGIAWVEKIYAAHRPPIRDFEGPAPPATSA
jgi:glutathione S-transferase